VISPKLVEVGRHINIEIHTLAEVQGISGEAGNFRVNLTKEPRYIDMEKCTGCGVCIEACPIRYEVQLPQAERAARRAYAAATEEAEVAAIIDRYRETRGNLLPVLLAINKKFNWLPRGALEHVSDELKITMSEILRVATFYNAFSLVPRGRHIISVCLGTGCFVKGSPRVLERLERELEIKHGQTTEDARFSLDVVRCIGCCALAPAIRVGNDTFGRLTPEAVPKILQIYTEGEADAA
jgi:NADH-quinone oxidoreductase subunit E